MSVVFAIPDSERPDELIWYLARTPGDAEMLSEDDLASVRPDDILLVVSGRDVFLGSVTLVARNEKELRSAALYQLEDDLAEPVSQMFAAVGERPADPTDPRDVCVVSQARLTHWLSLLEVFPSAKSNARIVSDTSLLKHGADPLIFDGDDMVIVRDGEKVFALDRHNAAELLPALLQSPDYSRFTLIQGQGSVLDPASFTARRNASYPEFVSQYLSPKAGLDIRQGEYRAHRPMDIGFARRWKGSLVLASMAAILWLGFTGLSVMRLNAETGQLYKRAVSAYQAAFPDERNVVDPHASVMSKLRLNPGAQSVRVTELLSTFYRGLESIEGVEIESVSFNSETGRLTTSLKFTGYEDRDRLKQALESLGLLLELGGVSQEDGFLVGQAVIRTNR